jgi:zinc protease
MSFVSLSALKTNLEASLDLYADVVLNPSFPQTDFERLQRQQIAGIQREKVTPIQMALRVFPGLIYGEDHAYGLPLTGSGTETSVPQITTETLADFHRTWFRPNNATLVVVGDVTMAEVRPMVERLFRGWEQATTPTKNIAEVDLVDGGTVYVMDRPGSPQSIIFAGHLAPPKSEVDEQAVGMANTILGGAFVSRVNLNLREDKHWAYGAFTVLWDAKAQRPFFAYAPVQADKTAESMVEIRNELTGVVGDNPITQQELEFAREQQILALPGQWETIAAVNASVDTIVEYGLADDYYQGYGDRIAAMDLARVNSAAKSLVHPENVVYLVVGDRSQIEARMRELGFTDIRALDADGKPAGRTP